ncbi:MAG: hypothetical protein V1725_07160 [archaeon]
MTPLQFLEAYERACRIVDIPDSWKIMTRSRFEQLTAFALSNAKRAIAQRLERKGYGQVPWQNVDALQELNGI